jgi:cobalamin biosynthesis protein CbiG
VSADEVLALVDAALAGLGATRGSVSRLATVEAKATEPGVVDAARLAGWQLVAYPAAALAAVPVPNPSTAAHAAAGTPSVAEAACLLAAGPGSRLVAPKRTSARVTAAVAAVATSAGTRGAASAGG